MFTQSFGATARHSAIARCASLLLLLPLACNSNSEAPAIDSNAGDERENADDDGATTEAASTRETPAERDEPVDDESSETSSSAPSDSAALPMASTQNSDADPSGGSAIDGEGSLPPASDAGGTTSPGRGGFVGDCANATPIDLPQDEVAQRLSRLLFAAEPSVELLDWAAGGGLDTLGEVECRALALIEKPDVERGLLEFLNAWLGMDPWEFPPNAQPTVGDGSTGAVSDEVWAEMLTEADAFLKDFASSSDRTLRHLLSEPESEVGAALALHYGIELPAMAPAHVVVPGHHGLLTLGFFTGSLERIGERGWWLSNHFQCLPMPREPETGAPSLVAGDGETYRSTYLAMVAGSPCNACHALVDPLGLAFENFDLLGRLQTEEAGQAIETSGTLPSGAYYADTAAFMDLLADDASVGTCMAQTALKQAVGESLAMGDVDVVASYFSASDRDLRHLLVGVTQTKSFWQ